MPSKRVARQQCSTRVEHTLHVFFRAGFLLVGRELVELSHLEEGRRWKLLAVACDDELPPAVDAVDCVLRRHLGRLVEHDQVEGVLRRKKVANG